jgi:hypothetical protein
MQIKKYNQAPTMDSNPLVPSSIGSIIIQKVKCVLVQEYYNYKRVR